jgi:cytochrome c2
MGTDMRRLKKIMTTAVGLFLVSATAYAFPWDIDLVDTPMLRGYEWQMAATPEGSVFLNHHRLYVYSDELFESSNGDNCMVLVMYYGIDGSKMVSPHIDPNAPEVLKQGEVMFKTYCQTCHGIKGTVQDQLGEAWNVSSRWTAPIPGLAMKQDDGKLLLTGGQKPDPMLYLYIRNGYGRMPAYAHAMYDEEIWSTIHYLKSLNGQSF